LLLVWKLCSSFYIFPCKYFSIGYNITIYREIVVIFKPFSFLYLFFHPFSESMYVASVAIGLDKVFIVLKINTWKKIVQKKHLRKFRRWQLAPIFSSDIYCLTYPISLSQFLSSVITTANLSDLWLLETLSLGLIFINVLRTAFTLADPKSVKKIDHLTVFFTFLWSASVKAVCRMLIKLSLKVLVDVSTPVWALDSNLYVRTISSQIV